MRTVCCLDALGTLVALEPPVPRLRAALAARGVEVAEEDAAAGMRAEIGHYRDHHDRACDRAHLDALRTECAEVLRTAAGLGAVPLATVRTALLEAIRFTPYPEVPDVLRALRGRGARLVVVSNWDVSLHDVLEETGLRPLLDGVVTSAERGHAKPDPLIFAAALDGADPRRALHAGDDLRADVEGARAAGLRAVLVARSGAAPPPGVDAVADLTGVVDRLPS